ncbi:MAG TPA: hypothetical protein VK363_18540 [Pyrinomonadaceae bacterium]|nr:hypothetical protein [Pyrinomonadaceae bacterium]
MGETTGLWRHHNIARRDHGNNLDAHGLRRAAVRNNSRLRGGRV